MTTDTTKAALASAISHVLKSYGFNSAMCADELAALLRANAAVVPEDFHTHRQSWRNALVIAETHADRNHIDIDDKAYWRHELAAFDRAYAELEAAPSAPVLAEPQKGDQQ